MFGEDFLARFDRELGGGPRRWSDVVVVRNVGPLVARESLDGDRISTRGFNAILLARDGTPSHFLKVRASENAPFQREAAITAALARHSAARDLVPVAQFFVHPPSRVLAEQFIDAEALEVALRRGKRGDWASVAADMLCLHRKLAPAMADVAASIGLQPTSANRPLEALERLRPLGLEAAAASELAGYLQRDLPAPVPQHGDYWPRNIVVSPRETRVLDFETCGEVWLPLYDVFHMIRGCVLTVAGGSVHWLAAWGETVSGPLKSAFRQAAADLDAEQVEAAAVAYSIDVIDRLHARGNAPERLAGRVREAKELAALLRSGIVRRILD